MAKAVHDTALRKSQDIFFIDFENRMLHPTETYLIRMLVAANP